MLQLSNAVAGTASGDVLPRARGVQSLQSQPAFCWGHYTRERQLLVRYAETVQENIIPMQHYTRAGGQVRQKAFVET